MRASGPGIVVLALWAAPAMATGTTATASGEASAEVVSPLVVSREADLDFGSILAASTPGTVTVGAAGQVRYRGGAVAACVGGACDVVHPARFAVRGEGGRSYVVSVPVTVTARGTAIQAGEIAPPLVVSGLTVRSDSRPGGGAGGVLDGAGRDGFGIGGTLEVPAGLPAARYEATVPVMVTYG